MMWAVIVGACVCAILMDVALADNSMYDLSYDMVSDKMPMLPNNSYHMDNVTYSGVPLRTENLTMTTAVGTHVQAPCRYQANQWCITDIPFAKLMGPVVVMSLNATTADTPISRNDLTGWESKNSAISSGSIVLIKTNWGINWSNISMYVGTNTTVNSTNMHFPGLSPDAGNYLAGKNILGVGIDTMSVDYGQSNGTYPVHMALAQKNIYTIVNVNLSGVDEGKTKKKMAYVMPMKVFGAGAAPCRIFIRNAAYGLLSKPAMLVVGICLAILSYVNH